jgi:hypothetical protein
MQLRPEIQISSMIKSMMDVVIPAVDPVNKLAVEQAQLVVGMLSVMAAQLPVQFRFDHDELTRLCACAETLNKAISRNSAVSPALDHMLDGSKQASATLVRCAGDPAELLAGIRELREAISDVVKAVTASNDLDAALKVEKIILAMSKEQLLRDRSLLKVQGWEPDPAAVPDIRELLGMASAAV